MRRAGPSGAVFAAVAAGGFAGTLLRYGLGLGLPETAHFPATTLAINVAGSLVLGFLTGRWSRMLKGPDWLRAGIGPGLLGSFTTFSALSVAVASSWEPGRGGALVLFGYLVASLALGFAAAALGHRYGAGRRGATHRGGRDGGRDGGRRGSSAPPQAAP